MIHLKFVLAGTVVAFDFELFDECEVRGVIEVLFVVRDRTSSSTCVEEAEELELELLEEDSSTST